MKKYDHSIFLDRELSAHHFKSASLFCYSFFDHFRVMGEHKHKKKSKKEHKKHKRSKREDQEIDYSDPSLWVEKADEGSPSAEQSAIPTAASNAPTATATASNNAPVQRESWMLDDSFDFASLGRAQEKPESNKPDPDQVRKKRRGHLLAVLKHVSSLYSSRSANAN